MALSKAEGKLKHINENPACVQEFFQTLEEELTEAGGSWAKVASNRLESYLVTKGLDTVWPAIEPFMEPFQPLLERCGIEDGGYADVAEFITTVKRKDIANIVAEPKKMVPQFLKDHRADFVWLRLKTQPAAEGVDWSALKPQVDKAMEDDALTQELTDACFHKELAKIEDVKKRLSKRKELQKSQGWKELTKLSDDATDDAIKLVGGRNSPFKKHAKGFTGVLMAAAKDPEAFLNKLRTRASEDTHCSD